MMRRLLAALAALGILAAGLAGLPAFLLAAQRHLAGLLPSLGDLPSALTAPGDGGLFLLTLLAVGWVCWGVFVLAFGVELIARARGVRAPRLGPFVPQRSAAWAITAIAAVIATSAPSITPALTIREASVHPRAPGVTTSQMSAMGPAAERLSGDEVHTDEPVVQDYRVKRGDTLWDIADRKLDDPTAWPKIARASDEIRQPDGRRLTDPDLIIPGWTLHIPKAAHPDQDESKRLHDGSASRPGTDSRKPDVDGHANPSSAPTPKPVEPRLPTTPLRPPGGPGTPSSALPRTPLNPPPGSDRTVLAEPATASTPTGVPETLLRAGAGPSHDDGVLADRVPGLPDWVHPPFTPTRLEDHPETQRLVQEVLG